MLTDGFIITDICYPVNLGRLSFQHVPGMDDRNIISLYIGAIYMQIWMAIGCLFREKYYIFLRDQLS